MPVSTRPGLVARGPTNCSSGPCQSRRLVALPLLLQLLSLSLPLPSSSLPPHTGTHALPSLVRWQLSLLLSTRDFRIIQDLYVEASSW